MPPEKMLVENFKLAKYEAKVYLALLKGEMTPKQASTESGVPLPRVYDTLRSLQAKGFVQERAERFSAISVRAALESRKSQFDLAFSKEQKERESAILELTRVLEPSIRRTVDYDDNAVFLRGINSIMSKFREVVSESKDIILVATKSMGAKELFKPYLEERGAKAVRVLLSKKFAPTKADLQFIAQSGLRVRRAENTFLDLMVADERVVMIGVPDPTTQEEYHSIAVVIASRPFARSVRESLEDIWDQANEISPTAR